MGEEPPRVNFPRRGEKRVRAQHQMRVVADPHAYATGGPGLRWDADAADWKQPDTRWVLGRRIKPGFYAAAGEVTLWADSAEDVTADLGFVLIDTPPPKTHARRAVWSEGLSLWIFPEKYEIRDSDGALVNLVVALHPEDIGLKEGQTAEIQRR